MRWVLVALVVSVGGCGFRNIPGDGTDLGGGGGGGVDLAGGGGGVGPGPVGALPAGFCCTRREECRSRRCLFALNGQSFCSDDCDASDGCAAWGAALVCDPGQNYTCQPMSSSFSCLDPSTYRYGAKPFGACCASGFVRSGEECQGGLCVSVGPVSNPYFCTQGCIRGVQSCPSGYSCGTAGFCIPNDPNATYACTP